MKTWLRFFLSLVTLCVSSIIIPLVHSKCNPEQQLSLLHFKSSLLFKASLSSKLITWNSSTDCCSWVGVTCSTNGSVLGLDISSVSISGGIDNSSSLFHLQHLQSLNLADNELGNGSSIPSAVGQLMNLRIPSSKQFSTFPKSSFEGNKDLFGPPLTEDNTTRFSPPASIKSHKDEIDWNLITVEVGFTCGFGIAIGSLLFCKKWRKWYYRAMYNILLKIFPQLEERFGDHRRHVYISQRYWRR